jgi:hypothetical protein
LGIEKDLGFDNTNGLLSFIGDASTGRVAVDQNSEILRNCPMSQSNLSSARIKRIRTQGYFSQSDEEITLLAPGNRFAYQLCASLLIVGMVLENIPILLFMMIVAFLGVVLPRHPFDYIYNGFLAERWHRPKLPERSRQLKFACMIASTHLLATVILFWMDLPLLAYLVGGVVVVAAILVATIDFCIPSLIYNKACRIEVPGE